MLYMLYENKPQIHFYRLWPSVSNTTTKPLSHAKVDTALESLEAWKFTSHQGIHHHLGDVDAHRCQREVLFHVLRQAMGGLEEVQIVSEEEEHLDHLTSRWFVGMQKKMSEEKTSLRLFEEVECQWMCFHLLKSLDLTVLILIKNISSTGCSLLNEMTCLKPAWIM